MIDEEGFCKVKSTLQKHQCIPEIIVFLKKKVSFCGIYSKGGA